MSDFSFEARGKVWIISPLTLGDLKRFARWVQFRPWNEFQEMAGVIPETQYQEELSALLKECVKNRVDIDSPEYKAAMQSPAGIAHLVYLSLAHKQPTITPAMCEELLTTRNVDEVAGKVIICSGFTTEEELKKTKDRERLTSIQSIDTALTDLDLLQANVKS